MDFIEKIFGIAPDGGDGTFEFLLFAIPLIGICFVAWRRRATRRSRSASEGRSGDRREDRGENLGE
jgi:hypothetical protein